MDFDEFYMREALRLAQRGRGFVNPNPMVGAVIVKNKRIIARGYHRASGMPHAEIEALKKAGKRAKGATLYANLEPCCHFGKTPPCTDAIIRANIGRVVCAARDPNRIARGGIGRLRRAGIDVSVGLLEKEARMINEAFYTFHEKNRPFVALKFAASLDGKLAARTGDSKWITSETARAYARSLRGEYHAVLVGIETVLADNPHLGARAKNRPDPIRIVLDSILRLPMGARILRDGNVIVATTRRAPTQKKNLLETRGIRVLEFSGARISPKNLLASLQKMNVTSVLVEGGGTVLGSFIDAGIADKVYAFYAPILIGGENAATVGGRGVSSIATALRFKKFSTKRFDDTVLIVASKN